MSDRGPRGSTSIFPVFVRRLALLWSGVFCLVAVGFSFSVSGQRAYWLAWILTAAPFTSPTLVLSWIVARKASSSYRQFWWRFFVGLALAYAAGGIAVVARYFDSFPLLAFAAATGSVSYPFFLWAGVTILKVRSAGRALEVDLLDGAISVVALAAPIFYFLLVPSLASDDPLTMVLTVVGVAMLGLLYIAILNFFRLPRGERTGEILFSSVCALTVANVLLLALQSVSGYRLSAPFHFLIHGLNLSLLLLTPLYARNMEVDLGPTESGRVRRIHVLPYAALMLIPPLAIYAERNSGVRPWGPAYVMVILILLISLAAARQFFSSRETRRLNSELIELAEERRQLLDRMVKALEAERHRFGTELHETAIEAFAAIGAVLRTAYAQLPPDTAVAVREALSSLRSDMNERVERLRRLVVALRPPVLGDSGLEAALTAYVNQLFGDRRDIGVNVDVDPDLVLDWSGQVIVYRIAQESLLNVSKHADASRVGVHIFELDDRVVLVVEDDGKGFDASEAGAGVGLSSMRSLALLEGGRVEVRSSPGSGCKVRVEFRGAVGSGDSELGGGDAVPWGETPAPSRGLYLLRGEGSGDGSQDGVDDEATGSVDDAEVIESAEDVRRRDVDGGLEADFT